MLLRGMGLLLLVGVVGCGGPDSPVRPIALWSADSEALAGLRAAGPLEKHFGGVLNDPSAVQRMDDIGNRLAIHVSDTSAGWHFYLLAGEQVNAFSLPGGLIYVTRGLYDRIGSKDSLLAAVIAHEMGHVIHKDSLKPKPGTVAEALHREMAADRVGTELLAAAGYPPGGLPALLRAIADVQPTGWANARLDYLTEAGRPKTSPDVWLSTR